jgi:hypothetical protein
LEKEKILEAPQRDSRFDIQRLARITKLAYTQMSHLHVSERQESIPHSIKIA